MISICIPHLPYSDKINEVLDTAIRAYEENTHNDFEICLAINGGKGYDVPVTRSPVSYSTFPDSIGVSSGWNEALKLAKGGTIVFANNDVIPEKDWDVPLVSALEEHSVGIALPVVSTRDISGGYNDISDNLQGCFLAVRKNTLEHLASDSVDDRVSPCYGFDERFNPAYYEDTDLFLRVKLCGLSRITYHQSRVQHLKSLTMNDVFEDPTQISEESKVKFEEKWGHLGNSETLWNMCI